MKTIAASEAKAKFLGLLDDVERGETIIVTRYGKPIAKIVPDEESRREKTHKTFAELDRIRQEMPRMSVDEILAAIKKGRK